MSNARDAWIAASGPFAAAIVSGAVVVAGYMYSQATKDREISLAYVQMSVDILSRPPEKSQENLRKWAFQIVGKFAPIPLTDEIATELSTQTLPPSRVIPAEQSAVALPQRKSEQAAVSPTLKSGQAVIPSNIARMWVFYQNKEDKSPNGCKRPPNADPISPTDFSNRLDEFRSYRSSNPSYQVIVTAELDIGENWDAAARSISISGENLARKLPFWCNGTENIGYELP